MICQVQLFLGRFDLHLTFIWPDPCRYHSNLRLTGTWRFGYVGCLINNSATNVNLLGLISKIQNSKAARPKMRFKNQNLSRFFKKESEFSLNIKNIKNPIKVSIFQLTILSIDRSITVLPSSNSKIIQKLKTKRREAKFSIIVSYFKLIHSNLHRMTTWFDWAGIS